MGRPPDIEDYNCIKLQLNKIIRNVAKEVIIEKQISIICENAIIRCT